MFTDFHHFFIIKQIISFSLFEKNFILKNFTIKKMKKRKIENNEKNVIYKKSVTKE